MGSSSLPSRTMGSTRRVARTVMRPSSSRVITSGARGGGGEKVGREVVWAGVETGAATRWGGGADRSSAITSRLGGSGVEGFGAADGAGSEGLPSCRGFSGESDEDSEGVAAVPDLGYGKGVDASAGASSLDFGAVALSDPFRCSVASRSMYLQGTERSLPSIVV